MRTGGWLYGLAAASAVFVSAAPEATAQQEDVALGQRYYTEALEAYKQEQFEKSVDLLKKAYEADPNPLYVYNRIIVLEKTREHRLALVLLDEYRRRMLEHPEIVEQDLLDLEERLRAEVARQDRGPGMMGDGVEVADTVDPAGGVNWLGWSLVGGGALAAGGALATYLLGNSLHEELRCAPNSGADRTGCAPDAEPYPSQEAFEADQDRLALYDGLTIGLAALSVGALGWGIYELVSGGADDGEGTADLRLQLAPKRVSVGVELRF